MDFIIGIHLFRSSFEKNKVALGFNKNWWSVFFGRRDEMICFCYHWCEFPNVMCCKSVNFWLYDAFAQQIFILLLVLIALCSMWCFELIDQIGLEIVPMGTNVGANMVIASCLWPSPTECHDHSTDRYIFSAFQ